MAKINNKKSAEMLRSLRIAKGETQAKLAKYLGVSRAAVCNYENGTRVPSDEFKVKLARHYNVTVGALFFNER